ncbi:hypothetical protein N9Y81_04615 [Akkermansiaceae bacterium]|nr:hypothetical protein [Akkermansiaceae bacterium]
MKKLLLLTLLAAPLVVAGPLQPENIPAQAQWYLHGDLTGIRETNTGGFVLAQIRKDEADKFADIKALFGFDLINDLTDVTLFGTGKGDEIAITLSGDFDRARLEEVILQADTYKLTTHGTVTIHQWEDKGSTQHAGFHGDNTVIISQQKELLELALDVLARKKPGLKADLQLPSDQPVVVAFANIQKIEMPLDEGSQIIRKADSILMTLGEKRNRLVVDMVVETDSSRMARRMMHVVQGLVSLGELADDTVEDLDIQHAGQTEGKTMTMTMSLPATKALALIAQLK